LINSSGGDQLSYQTVILNMHHQINNLTKQGWLDITLLPQHWVCWAVPVKLYRLCVCELWWRCFVEDYFFDIHCVLVTQVNDQKTQRQLTASVFFSYKPAVVNYRWGYFSLLLVFLGSIESQKSNCPTHLISSVTPANSYAIFLSRSLILPFYFLLIFFIGEFQIYEGVFHRTLDSGLWTLSRVIGGGHGTCYSPFSFSKQILSS